MLKFKIRLAKISDLPAIGSIVEDWHDHSVPTLEPIKKSIEGDNDWKFFVAEADDGNILGVMGVALSDIDPELVPNTKGAELVSAYVSHRARGHGVGRALADKVESAAIDLGANTLLIVSGSRNRESGYPFWNRRYGQPLRVDADYFAPGAERVVWSKKLMLKG